VFTDIFAAPFPHEFVIWPHLTSRNWEKERLKKIAKMNFLNDLFDFFQADILLLLKRKKSSPRFLTHAQCTHTYTFSANLCVEELLPFVISSLPDTKT